MPPRRGRKPARADEPRGGDAGGGPGGRILIDGRNVQHALARANAAGPGAPLPTTSLIARLRAAFSPPTEVELILDGHPGGSVSGRVAPSFTVTYSRHATADEVIGDRVADALVALGPSGAWSVIVVSDDREVRDHARRNGARVESAAWLGQVLRARSPAGGSSIGHGRPPRLARGRNVSGT